jgi:hypothetical protein
LRTGEGKPVCMKQKKLGERHKEVERKIVMEKQGIQIVYTTRVCI